MTGAPPPSAGAGPPRPEPARRRLFVDLSPLRESRDYRLLFFGQVVSWLGRQVTVVAVPYQVYVLTG
ncbi:MAG TPA: hypothetical protein VG455_14105 [Acidimicrobiales bacterium]|nr:hypothetical protein [Acidimicrobiales bacterium]